MTKYNNLICDDYDQDASFSLEFTCIHDHKKRMERLKEAVGTRAVQLRLMAKTSPDYCDLKEAIKAAAYTLEIWQDVLDNCAKAPKLTKKKCKHAEFHGNDCYLLSVAHLDESDPMIDEDDWLTSSSESEDIGSSDTDEADLDWDKEAEEDSDMNASSCSDSE